MSEEGLADGGMLDLGHEVPFEKWDVQRKDRRL